MKEPGFTTTSAPPTRRWRVRKRLAFSIRAGRPQCDSTRPRLATAARVSAAAADELVGHATSFRARQSFVIALPAEAPPVTGAKPQSSPFVARFQPERGHAGRQRSPARPATPLRLRRDAFPPSFSHASRSRRSCEAQVIGGARSRARSSAPKLVRDLETARQSRVNAVRRSNDPRCRVG